MSETLSSPQQCLIIIFIEVRELSRTARKTVFPCEYCKLQVAIPYTLGQYLINPFTIKIKMYDFTIINLIQTFDITIF